MNIEKIKEMLKSKKGIVISSTVVALVVIGAITGVAIHNKSKVEVNNQIVETNKKKDNTEEKEVKDKLEEIKKIDVSKLSEEERKNLESKIADIEKLISNKEYAKAKTDIESVKSDINTKNEELVKKEEAKDENKDEKIEENKEVVSNNTGSNSSDTSSNTSSNTSNSGNASSSNQEPVQQPTTPPVEEEPVRPTQAPVEPAPQPQPPVVETPSYPSVAEVKQRLIAYGQGRGLKYDPSISSNTEGTVMQGTDQMWSSEMGNSVDGQTLFNGLVSAGCYAFNVEVVDLGNGFCSMKAYGIMNWD